MIRILNRWKHLSATRKLYFVVGTMAVLIASELAILTISLEQVSSVRAFIEGEALWSKAQKGALLELKKFQRTTDEKNYQNFLDYLKVPAGDHIARLEMLKPHPDLQVVRAGFIQGRIHPDDTDKMIHLLQRFYWISYVSEAIKAWTDADVLLEKLRDHAEALHQAVRFHKNKDAAILLNEIDDINNQLTPIEDHFSRALSDGSRWLESSVLTILLLMVMLVETTGLTLTIVTGREIAAIANANASFLREARKYSRIRDEFLSVASHELKTPLTSLGLQLQLLQKGLQEVKDHPQVSNVYGLSEQSLVSVGRIGALVDELLDLTRIRAGHLEIHKQRCDLSSVVQESILILAPEAAKHGSPISVEAPKTVTGHFDPSRIHQVVTNLISNAIKYGDGKPIVVSIDKQGNKAKIAVRDHGRGIAEDKLSTVFQMFQRVDQDPSTPGLGLGLYISSEIIKAHGGKISAESRIGEGSIFTMELDTQSS